MSTQRFAKNATELARAFGLPLSPRKKKDSLATVTQWMAEPTFPKKQRHGWELVAVFAWVESKRKANPSPQSPPQRGEEDETDEGRSQDSGLEKTKPLDFSQPSEAEREKILSRLPADFQIRLRGLYEKWKNPNSKESKALTKEEKQELIATGLIKAVFAPASPDENSTPAPVKAVETGGDIYDSTGRLKNCRSQRDLAGRLQFHFRGRVSISSWEVMYSNWRTKPNNLPNGVPAPPGPERNEWPTQEAADWFEKYMLPYYAVARTQDNLGGKNDNIFSRVAEAEAKETINRARIVEIDLENKERQHSDRWIETAEAINMAGRMVAELRDWFRSEMERLAPLAWRDWARANGFPDAQVELIQEHARAEGVAVVDEMDARCEAAGRETETSVARIVAEKKQQ